MVNSNRFSFEVGDGNKAKGTRKQPPPPAAASNTNKHIGESTKHGGLRTFRELIRTETDVLDRWFAIAEQFNQTNRCRKAALFYMRKKPTNPKLFRKIKSILSEYKKDS